MEKRALLRKLEEAKHKPPIIVTPEIKDAGDRLLQKAKEEIKRREIDANKRIADYSYDVAGYIRNKARGTVFSVGGIGKGQYFGGGRWRYMPKKGWEKLD